MPAVFRYSQYDVLRRLGSSPSPHPLAIEAAQRTQAPCLICSCGHVNPSSCPRRLPAGPARIHLAPALGAIWRPRLHVLSPPQKRCPQPATKAGLPACCRSDQACRTCPRRCCHLCQTQGRKDGPVAARTSTDQQGTTQGRLGYHERNVAVPVAKGQPGHEIQGWAERGLAGRRKATQRTGSLLLQEHRRCHEYRLCRRGRYCDYRGRLHDYRM